MMNIPAAKIFFPEDDRKQIVQKIDNALESGQLTLGKYSKEFEEKFASYIGVKYAIAVNSGTSSLEIPLRIFDVKNKSVIVPTNTFFATPASVIHAGGKVQFADISEHLCIDPDSLQETITRGTKGVIVVHIGGLVSPEIREIRKICDEHGLFLLEDAAHAHGSTLDGKKAGSFGDAGSFSFYPTKVMTSGEGGMIVTDDKKIYDRALVFRDQGKAGFLGNVHTEMGYNWRMSEIHAIIGLSQFQRLEEFIKRRREVALMYDNALKGVTALTPVHVPSNNHSNYYKYCAILKKGLDRTAVKKELKEKFGVSMSGEVYELPCHMQPVFKDMLGFKGGELPVAEDLCSRHVCLPVFAKMTDEQAKYVTDSIKEILK